MINETCQNCQYFKKRKDSVCTNEAMNITTKQNDGDHGHNAFSKDDYYILQDFMGCGDWEHKVTVHKELNSEGKQ